MSGLEQLLEETRAPLPGALRERVLRTAPRARPRPSSAWFAVAVALAAAVLVNFANSAGIPVQESAWNRP
jgi:hypothetical protein